MKTGQRVRVIGNPIGLVLGSHLGTVEGPSLFGGYVLVRLDEPARTNTDNPAYAAEVPVIVWAEDNLEVVE